VDTRGPGWSRWRAKGGITGPWRVHGRCLDPAEATSWLRHNDVLNWSQPTRIGDRWYAVCQNGVASDAVDNERVGIVHSDDYLEWHEFDNPVTPRIRRPDGTPVVSSQQFLLPPEDGAPWRILLGARGEVGPDSYMYVIEANGDGHS